jgi:hypothetical protein
VLGVALWLNLTLQVNLQSQKSKHIFLDIFTLRVIVHVVELQLLELFVVLQIACARD